MSVVRRPPPLIIRPMKPSVLFGSIHVPYVILYATPGVIAKTGYRIRPELHWPLHAVSPTNSPWTEFLPVRPEAGLMEMAKPESTVQVAQGPSPPHSKSP